jgi:hypothetical protein
MGLTAITGVAGALLSKIESLHGSKTSQSSAAATQLNPTSDASTVSDPGKFFSQLQALSQQNPAEFKKITAQVAQQLQTAASATASSQTGVLNQMASNFKNASQTGSFSDLFTHASQTAPQQASTAPAGHPHHQYASSSDAADSTTVNSIFSQALSQIKTDLGSAAALKISGTPAA